MAAAMKDTRVRATRWLLYYLDKASLGVRNSLSIAHPDASPCPCNESQDGSTRPNVRLESPYASSPVQCTMEPHAPVHTPHNCHLCVANAPALNVMLELSSSSSRNNAGNHPNTASLPTRDANSDKNLDMYVVLTSTPEVGPLPRSLTRYLMRGLRHCHPSDVTNN